MDSSPFSPAIDGDVCDEDIFSSPLNRDAAGFGDKDDDDSLVDDSSTVAGAIVEDDDIERLRILSSAIGINSLQRPTILNGGLMISWTYQKSITTKQGEICSGEICSGTLRMRLNV